LEAPDVHRRFRRVGGAAVSWTGSTPPSVLDQPPPAEDPMKVSHGPATALVVVFLGLLLGALGTPIHLPYAVMSPGPITNVLGPTTHSDGTTSDLIVVSGHETYPTTGSLELTTGPINRGAGDNLA